MQYFLNWAALSDLWTTRAIRYMRQCSTTKHPSAKLFMGDVKISVLSRQIVAPIPTIYTWIKIICTWFYGFLIVTLFSIILFSLSVVDLGIGTTCVNARNMSKMAHIQENKHWKVISSKKQTSCTELSAGRGERREGLWKVCSHRVKKTWLSSSSLLCALAKLQLRNARTRQT